MKNYLLYLLIPVFFISCNNGNDPLPTDKKLSESTLTRLEYSNGVKISGDDSTSFLGYGYDATGLCDSISVRGKVLDMSLISCQLAHANTAFSKMISANNFSELSLKVLNSNVTAESGIALSSHLRSLLKLAYKTDLMDSKYSFAYYSCNAISPHFYFYASYTEMEKAFCPVFKQDIVSLSAQELVSKYGTHILTNIFLGKRFEVLYRCESPSYIDAEHGLYKRMQQFCGGIFGIYASEYEKPLLNSNEQMIYNTVGLNPKQCGVIQTTDNNSDSIALNIYSSFNADLNYNFVSVGENGLTPLYDLISDPLKKQEMKTYIETYIASKSSRN